MGKTVYLDNSATTCPSETAVKALTEAALIYGNPSSVHFLGVESKRLLDSCREKVAKALGVRKLANSALVFTASGSEANALAIIGYHEAKKRVKNVPPVAIFTDGEHPSVENAMLRLEKNGWKLVRIPTVGGEIDMNFLRETLRENKNVSFASFMLVNNETGAVYDVKAAASLVKLVCPDCHVHCDAVQGFMKVRFSPQSLGVDTVAVSAHKIHAPRGAAALYISAETVKKKNIAPVIPGGGQEKNFRSGTENLLAIAAFAAAAEEESENFAENCAKTRILREYLEEKLASLAEITVKRPKKSVSEICNITLPRIKSETMLNFLSGEGICVSAGSACSASSGHLSAALAAFGCTKDEIDSSVRISLSHTNEKEDIDALTYALDRALSSLARF